MKFSTLWEGGAYRFQQIRDQEYDVVVCMGVSPQEVQLWAIPKAVLQQQPDGVRPQHGGAAGRDTLWLDVTAGAPHHWLGEYGGALNEGTSAFERLIG